MGFIRTRFEKETAQGRRNERFCVKGSSVIEMSYIIPLFLGLFVLLIQTVFYYHDKAVLNGAASETAVLGAQAARKPGAEYDLEKFFRERVRGKLIFMTDTDLSIQEGEREIRVSASAGKGFMELDICQKALIVKPEVRIRQMG